MRVCKIMVKIRPAVICMSRKKSLTHTPTYIYIHTYIYTYAYTYIIIMSRW